MAKDKDLVRKAFDKGLVSAGGFVANYGIDAFLIVALHTMKDPTAGGLFNGKADDGEPMAMDGTAMMAGDSHGMLSAIAVALDQYVKRHREHIPEVYRSRLEAASAELDDMVGAKQAVQVGRA